MLPSWMSPVPVACSGKYVGTTKFTAVNPQATAHTAIGKRPRASSVVHSRTAAVGTTLEEIERSHIHRMLSTTLWRIVGRRGAAELLGLKPSTLRSRLRKLGIRRGV